MLIITVKCFLANFHVPYMLSLVRPSVVCLSSVICNALAS